MLQPSLFWLPDWWLDERMRGEYFAIVQFMNLYGGHIDGMEEAAQLLLMFWAS